MAYHQPLMVASALLSRAAFHRLPQFDEHLLFSSRFFTSKKFPLRFQVLHIYLILAICPYKLLSLFWNIPQHLDHCMVLLNCFGLEGLALALYHFGLLF